MKNCKICGQKIINKRKHAVYCLECGKRILVENKLKYVGIYKGRYTGRYNKL